MNIFLKLLVTLLDLLSLDDWLEEDGVAVDDDEGVGDDDIGVDSVGVCCVEDAAGHETITIGDTIT